MSSETSLPDDRSVLWEDLRGGSQASGFRAAREPLGKVCSTTGGACTGLVLGSVGMTGAFENVPAHAVQCLGKGLVASISQATKR